MITMAAQRQEIIPHTCGEDAARTFANARAKDTAHAMQPGDAVSRPAGLKAVTGSDAGLAGPALACNLPEKPKSEDPTNRPARSNGGPHCETNQADTAKVQSRQTRYHCETHPGQAEAGCPDQIQYVRLSGSGPVPDDIHERVTPPPDDPNWLPGLV